MTEQELIEKAKRDYPIGTKFSPAHLKQRCTTIVTNDSFSVSYNNSRIHALTDEGEKCSSKAKYGDNSYERIVYFGGKWAEIIYKPEPKSLPTDNWCVKLTPENKKAIIDWGPRKAWSGTTNYYGIANGLKECKLQAWGTVLTTEEFYQVIGKTPEVKQDPKPSSDLYPIGTEVVIKLDSEYAYQGKNTNGFKVKGRIIAHNTYTTDHCYRIEWLELGKQNSYRPQDIELWKEEPAELTSLPERWCIAVNHNTPEIGEYFNHICNTTCYSSSRFGGYLNWDRQLKSAVAHSNRLQLGYTEITFEQFKKWVLDKQPVKTEEPKSIDIKAIQEECKKRFPIGSRIRSTVGIESIIIDDDYLYRIIGDNQIWANSGKGCLYLKGVYATLLEPPQSKFKVGDTVIGNSKASARYHITKTGYIGKVTYVHGDGTFALAGLGGKTWPMLEEGCFDLHIQSYSEGDDTELFYTKLVEEMLEYGSKGSDTPRDLESVFKNPTPKGHIDTHVNNMKSVKTELYQPKKTIYF